MKEKNNLEKCSLLAKYLLKFEFFFCSEGNNVNLIKTILRIGNSKIQYYFSKLSFIWKLSSAYSS